MGLLEMNTQSAINFERIRNAIEYIDRNYLAQPDLDEVASFVHLSPYHFQRLFTEWAGVSPKKFLQYISLGHAKKLLRERKSSLLDTAYEAGLSGTGRLHDLFIGIEGMTPGEFKNGGANLAINYSMTGSPFGNVLVASTAKGICHLAFADDPQAAFTELTAIFPNAHFIRQSDIIQDNALNLLAGSGTKHPLVKLHIKGTAFQLKVWEALLRIPMGSVTSYSNLAGTIGKPHAARAVGTAVANNRVAFLIPCHRVIQSTGAFGQYRWENSRKKALIGWESCIINNPQSL